MRKPVLFWFWFPEYVHLMMNKSLNQLSQEAASLFKNLLVILIFSVTYACFFMDLWRMILDGHQSKSPVSHATKLLSLLAVVNLTVQTHRSYASFQRGSAKCWGRFSSFLPSCWDLAILCLLCLCTVIISSPQTRKLGLMAAR